MMRSTSPREVGVLRVEKPMVLPPWVTLPAGRSRADAWIAAAVIHLDEHFVTFDRGFRRLLPASALTVLDPTLS